MTKKFNDSSAKKVHDYMITLVPLELDAMSQQVRPFTFRRQLADWVAAETGVVPAIEIANNTVATESPQMLIQCTEDLILKIQAKFGADIGEVEHIRKLSEIPPGERGCWKPRHGR